MDLFRPTSVSSLNHKWYCLVMTDDFSRFTWTFFLRTKDETSSILRNFITEIENLKDLKVKIITYDNGGEFKNKEMNEFCTKKGIRIEFSNARTPKQNGVAKRRYITLIEVSRTMLADAKLPVTFWAEAVNTACYVKNRVLVNKSQNKTPYELFNSRIPAIGFLRPCGCHVMILNTLDHLGKFDAKGDEGYFVGYSLSSKAFRVFNKRTKKVEEHMHVDFLKNKLIEKGAGTSSTNISGTKDVASQAVKKDVSSLRYIALPNCGISNPTAISKIPSSNHVEPAVSLTVESKILTTKEAPSLDNALTLSNRFEDTFRDTTNAVTLNKVEDDLSNIETSIPVSPTPTFRIHKDHPKSQIIGPVDTPMDVKTAFLYGTINKEVYVMQPPGFQDLEFPERVYKVEKAMYRLHQAPRA
nr:retrovirus-related Pol polyprotein from transposon TNT 1-94 [Tanacetum cinerariifolium]